MGQGDNPVNTPVQKPRDTRQGHKHDTTNVKCSRCDGKHAPSECYSKMPNVMHVGRWATFPELVKANKQIVNSILTLRIQHVESPHSMLTFENKHCLI